LMELVGILSDVIVHFHFSLHSTYKTILLKNHQNVNN
jgi:hypothetical protein